MDYSRDSCANMLAMIKGLFNFSHGVAFDVFGLGWFSWPNYGEERGNNLLHIRWVSTGGPCIQNKPNPLSGSSIEKLVNIGHMRQKTVYSVAIFALVSKEVIKKIPSIQWTSFRISQLAQFFTKPESSDIYEHTAGEDPSHILTSSRLSVAHWSSKALAQTGECQIRRVRNREQQDYGRLFQVVPWAFCRGKGERKRKTHFYCRRGNKTKGQ